MEVQGDRTQQLESHSFQPTLQVPPIHGYGYGDGDGDQEVRRGDIVVSSPITPYASGWKSASRVVPVGYDPSSSVIQPVMDMPHHAPANKEEAMNAKVKQMRNSRIVSKYSLFHSWTINSKLQSYAVTEDDIVGDRDYAKAICLASFFGTYLETCAECCYIHSCDSPLVCCKFGLNFLGFIIPEKCGVMKSSELFSNATSCAYNITVPLLCPKFWAIQYAVSLCLYSSCFSWLYFYKDDVSQRNKRALMNALAMQEGSSSVAEALQEIKCEIIDNETIKRAEKKQTAAHHFPRSSIGYYCNYCFPYCGPCILCCSILLVPDICDQLLCCSREQTAALFCCGGGYQATDGGNELDLDCIKIVMFVLRFFECCG